MDPLSVAASIISLIGAAAAVAKILKKLRSEMKSAPDSLCSMINETSDLQLVLDASEIALREWRKSSDKSYLPESFSSVSDILRRMQERLEELSRLANRCINEGKPERRSMKVNLRWLKERSKAKAILNGLKEAKSDLLVLLETHSL